jgi:hypothetical protein
MRLGAAAIPFEQIGVSGYGSIIVGAAHVIAAFLAEEFALTFRQPQGADGAIEHRLVARFRWGRGWRCGFGGVHG